MTAHGEGGAGGPESVVASTYDRLGERYWKWAERVDPPLRSEYSAVATSRLGPDARVVELGCGPGAPVGAVLCRRHRYIGVDVSTTMLELARHNAPEAHLVRADMTEIAFRPGSIDAVVAFYSVIHVPRARHAEVLAAIANWLRPGGRFAASLGARDNPGDVESDWLGGGAMFWSFFDAATNLRLLEAAGLEVERSEEVVQWEDGQPHTFLWVLARRC